MTDILLKEIDEEVRKDRLQQLWNRHGRKAVALAVALILGAGVFTVWQNRRAGQEITATTALASILQSSKPDNAADTQKKLIAFADQASADGAGGRGASLLARLYAASWVGDPAQRQQALQDVQKIAGDSGLPSLYRDLAQLLSVQMQLDTGDVAALQKQLTPLRAAGSPWRHTARELSALLDLRAGNTNGAKTTLEALKADQGAPQDLRERAGKVLATLGV